MNAIKSFLFGGPGGATRMADVGLLITRVMVGLLLAFGHGLGKVWTKDGLGPSAGFVKGVENLGFPAPTAFAWAAALTEFVGGILLAAGLLTRPAALALAFNMVVAAFGQHLGDPFFPAKRGEPAKELALLYMAPGILFLLAGAGRYSLDALIARRAGGGGKTKAKAKPAA